MVTRPALGTTQRLLKRKSGKRGLINRGEERSYAPSPRDAVPNLLNRFLKNSFSLLAIILLSTPFFSSSVFAAPSPACDDIITASTTLTADIGPCDTFGLTIGANNIVLDCAGHKVTAAPGHAGVGIYLLLVTGATVKNCKVDEFSNGFFLGSSSNNTLVGNVANNTSWGFFIAGSNNRLLKNTADESVHGFVLTSFADNNTLDGNTANTRDDGFSLFFSSGNTLARNVENGALNGFDLQLSSGNIVRGNTAKGSGDVGFSFFLSSNNTVNMNTVNDYRTGFVIDASQNINLTKNTANNNAYGFAVEYHDNSLRMNVADNNSQYGYYAASGGGFLIPNSYFKNECTGNLVGGSFPAGLCTPQN
jgi:parallel beta-helix repeat protein